MLRGATCSACAIVGTAVLRMVVSSDSMKNATATSHGRSCLRESVAARTVAVGIMQTTLRFLKLRAVRGRSGDSPAYPGYFRPGRRRARLGVLRGDRYVVSPAA